MITISLCMIAKNEDTVLGRCLESIKDIVDEINIVDTGSTDRTKEIASQYTNRVFDFKWTDDFAAARNYSFSKATKEYVLWLDCDDIILEADRIKLKKLKETLDCDIDMVMFKYNIGLNDNGNPVLTNRERLVKRSRDYKWIGFVHEYLPMVGNVCNSDITVTHKKINKSFGRNLNIYRRKLNQGYTLEVRDIYYYAKELYNNEMWEDSIEVFEEFFSMESWFEDKIIATCKLAECYQYVGNPKKEREVLMRSFEYSCPRAEIMYRLGHSFEREEKFDRAIFWYESIFIIEIPRDYDGYIDYESWTWKPHLQLCVCYYRLGDIEKANYHHVKAYEINPNHPYIKANQRFFESQKGEC